MRRQGWLGACPCCGYSAAEEPFDACPYSGYSAAGEPFDACPYSGYSAVGEPFRRLPLLRCTEESSRLLNSYVYVYMHANWLFGFLFGYTLAHIISIYLSCSMHIWQATPLILQIPGDKAFLLSLYFIKMVSLGLLCQPIPHIGLSLVLWSIV